MNSSFFLGSVAAAIGFFTLFKKFRFPQDTEDIKSSCLSLPSPPTSLSRTWKYHVFPSFHGADVRTTILSHILESFKRKGIDPFIDNHIPRSESIGTALKEAIKGSKIAIVLLSKNYASSSWCLDELVEIMKCREVLGQIVMTIFYEVDPTDIKKQTGNFGKAFKQTCKGKTKENIERWRRALEDVAKIAGEHSRNWCNEAAMIEEIATDVSNKLNNSIPSRDFDGLVGMKAHMEMMEQLLSLDLDEVRMIGIWGPPGIGKTTIARFLFSAVSHRFELGTIMVNIRGYYPRPCLDEYSAQLQLQKQMMSQIINQKDIMIPHLGVAQERLKDKKVFLVLDEVDQLGQLDALAKDIQWFGPGSRIIITTEDLRVLNAHRVNHIYKVKSPSSVEAFQIFCMYAFGQKHPYEGFYKLAREVTSLVGELPLGLKVLGSALQGMSKAEWKTELPRLKTRLDGTIENIIKFSYDALCSEDKYLFLYIACIFNYQLAHRVEGVLAKEFPHVRHGLQVLEERSLISIKDGKIQMHTLLEQFGKKTSREQFIHHGFTKRQLLVGERDTCELLSDDLTDSKRFIGINLDFSKTAEELNISENALERIHDFQFVRIDSHYFAQHKRLQLVLQDLIYHSQKIRSLCWEQFQNICLPSTFNLEFLVELNMRSSQLEKLWEGSKPLKNLKWMDLGNSRSLKELPDLSTATKLEELILEKCSSLVELPSSIGNAINLQRLNLQSCSSLLKLPYSIGNAINLQILNLQSCSSLLELPSSIGNAINLQELDLSYCSSLRELPSSIANATNLQILNLVSCTSLLELPPSIGKAINLQRLNLRNCLSLLELPSSIGNAINLKELDLSYCSSLVELPSSIGNAINLQKVFLNGCSSLVELPSSIMNITYLEELDLSSCSSLVKLPFSLGNAINLQKLHLSHCTSLVKIPSSIENATNLQILDLSNCSNFVELPTIGNATKLEQLNLHNCSSLVKLPSSINALNLQQLDLQNCSRVMELPALENATNLQKLNLQNCSSLQELPPSIGTATNLRELDIRGCSSLMEVPSSIGNLQKLCSMIMFGCSKLEALPTNINLKSLEILDLTDCSQLKSFPEISTNIKYLWLRGTAIKEVPLAIRVWSHLSDFHIPYFESLKESPHAFDIITELHLVKEDIIEVLPWVKGMSSLRKLRLYNCNNLVSLPQLSDSLSYLVAENCQSLKRLDCCFNNPNIRLEFVNCPKLNQEARDLIMHTSTNRYAILPGTELPSCFNHRATSGGSLTIKLNESPLPTSLRFKACFMLVKDEHESGDNRSSVQVAIDIMEKKKDLKVRCRHLKFGHRSIVRLLTEHIYAVEVEAKKVTSTELVFEFKTQYSKWKIGECGLFQILEVPS